MWQSVHQPASHSWRNWDGRGKIQMVMAELPASFFFSRWGITLPVLASQACQVLQRAGQKDSSAASATAGIRFPPASQTDHCPERSGCHPARVFLIQFVGVDRRGCFIWNWRPLQFLKFSPCLGNQRVPRTA